MNYWLLKTEPEEYSFDDLLRDGDSVWDGVSNNWALKHLRQMRTGDQTFIYHTGKQRAIVGIAGVTRDPYPDPALDDELRAVVNVEARDVLPMPVSLKAIKSDERFAELLLVKSSRLSVMPVSKDHWRAICKLGGR